MKRIKGLWPDICAFENLYQAYRLAAKGKQDRQSVQDFNLDLETQLFAIQRQLLEKNYTPGVYRQFQLYQGKPRTISAAPFRDRVVHHALMSQLEPLLDRQYIFDSYACRRGKGVHAAINRYQHYAARYAYVLKLDVANFFASIDHAILISELQRRIKDQDVLWLCERILAFAPNVDLPNTYFQGDDLLSPLIRTTGLPIGNLTSQIFANLYLDRLDHWAKERLRVPGYLRYVDDICVFADSLEQLHDWREAIADKLDSIHLRMHAKKRTIFRSTERVEYLGYYLSANRRWLKNQNGHRFRRKLKSKARQYQAGRISLEEIHPSVSAWIGHAQHAETLALRTAIFDAVVFYPASRDTEQPTGRG